MATRVTDGAAAFVSRVSQLRRSRARALLSKSEEKERLLAVYLSNLVPRAFPLNAFFKGKALGTRLST